MLVMAVRRIIGVSAVALLLAAPAADAHPLPKASGVKIGLHKVICSATGKLCDRPPLPGPTMECDWDRRGAKEIVYDPILDAEVEWVCRCTSLTNCGWFRLRIVPGQSWLTIAAPKRWVWDWQRKCPSIVCKKVRVKHYYPALYAEGGKL